MGKTGVITYSHAEPLGGVLWAHRLIAGKFSPSGQKLLLLEDVSLGCRVGKNTGMDQRLA